ncbi:MAG: 30S ribosomal protein S9 [Lentisphaerae bacterium]|jgi:small subunit ribosomal protein S9|nr:30S ribosomal protein S9 [Lentisphaerota bacterium]
MSEATEYIAIGRRKSASARVRLRPGTGKIIVNKREFEDYFPTESMRGFAVQPLVLTGKQADFDVVANISGGGNIGQAGALRHGITRALMEYNAELRPILKAAGMVTRNSKEKERKKPGRPGARKRFQFSKR